MINSLLIANRGEIACRIINTCQRLGIRTVAVYSDADKHARHVMEADEAIRIGPADVTQSYLNSDAIIEAVLTSGADGVHPGYGFLAEKTVLPELCEENQLVWVGPKASVIALMGSKIESKRIAEAAGVCSVPGYHGDEQCASHLLSMAKKIGFPILIKASAGGGGKGMRRVDKAADFQSQLLLAKQEALRSFGDERVLIEKLILRPRHLEVQLLGDQHGNLIHLYERECSIQRNYQKVIEEAPASYLSTRVRDHLFESALRLGREINYDSLGTVEFVLDEASDTPYFLEMNTRLQVEHPVTELVTGLDLVEWQIRVAAGEVLSIQQNQIQLNGWAVEARVNAEDPAKGYQPQVGKVEQCIEPDLPGVRIDSGVHAGSDISPNYDSMIAKVIAYGRTRKLAVQRLCHGLGAFEVRGVGTNQRFLHDIVKLPAFQSKPLSTLYMLEEYPDGWQVEKRIYGRALAAAAWHYLFPVDLTASEQASAWHRADGWRNISVSRKAAEASLEICLEDATQCSIKVRREGDFMTVSSTDYVEQLRVQRLCPNRLSLSGQDDESVMTVFIEEKGELLHLSWHGLLWKVAVRTTLEVMAQSEQLKERFLGTLKSPMPGLITELNVSVGQVVKVADLVLVMEAMKLMYPLESQVEGVVTAIHCEVGDTVAAGAVLVDIEATEA